MPLITTLAGASAKGYGMFAPPLVTGNFESIATATVSSATNSVTFSSIPSTFTHLQVRAFIIPAGEDNLGIKLNGDTGNNYAGHQIQGTGSSATSYAVSSTTMYLNGLFTGTSGYPFVAIYDFLDYTNTNKFKVVRGIAGCDGNAANTSYRVGLHSGLWRDTPAINSINFYTFYGNFIGANSHFALYGIKVAS